MYLDMSLDLSSEEWITVNRALENMRSNAKLTPGSVSKSVSSPNLETRDAYKGVLPDLGEVKKR